MENKFKRMVAGIALFGTLAVGLVGCGESAMAVRLASGNVMLGDVAFSNSSSLAIAESETQGTFNVTGQASFFSMEQAEAFWSGTAVEGDAYIVIELDYDKGSTIAYTTLAGAKSFTNEDEDDVMQIIIALTGEASTGETTRTFTVTKADETSTTYTLDTSAVVTTSAEE